MHSKSLKNPENICKKVLVMGAVSLGVGCGHILSVRVSLKPGVLNRQADFFAFGSRDSL